MQFSYLETLYGLIVMSIREVADSITLFPCFHFPPCNLRSAANKSDFDVTVQGKYLVFVSQICQFNKLSEHLSVYYAQGILEGFK